MPTKNEQIALSRAKTREKRKTQICKVFEVKIKFELLNSLQKRFLESIFLEVKWFWNDIIRSEDVFKYDASKKVVTRLDKDRNEFEYKLNVLGSSIKQSLRDEIKTNIKTLSTLKKKGKKVGRIGFVQKRNSVPLRQNGTTHTVIRSSERIRIQGCKKPFPVNGLHQFPSTYEIANARLIARATGYFIQITTYHYKEEENKWEGETLTPKKNEKTLVRRAALGLDFGIKNTVTTSDGNIFCAYIEETERLKRLQRKLSHQKPRSNNWYKTKKKIDIEYVKMTNRKDDLAKKLVHKLLIENEKVVIQDDNFNSWSKSHHNFGRKIQHGCLGRIKMLLKQHPEQVIVIGRFIATTKKCHVCDAVIVEGLGLNVREFECPRCGQKLDRDVQAAKMILKLGVEKLQHAVGVERTNQVQAQKRLHKKPVEKVSSIQVNVNETFFEQDAFNEVGIMCESTCRENAMDEVKPHTNLA